VTQSMHSRNGSSNGAWPVQPAGRISLLEVDPDLANGDGDARLAVAVFRFGAGAMPSEPPAETRRGCMLGYLVLKGLVLYESAVCGRAAAELLGPGDVVRAAGNYTSGTLPTRVTWTALSPVLLADLCSLDPHRSGAVIEALAMRCEDRAERAAIERSICSHVRVDVRVLAQLWHLADRFGVVVPGGVKVDLPLTHAVLARLVGARRPTVTTALQRLVQLGYVTREGRSFRLAGDATSVEDLDRRSPARDFAYPDGGRDSYHFQAA